MYHQGDLTDIIRAGGGETPPVEAAASAAAEWQFASNIPVTYSSEPGLDDFGDPFTHFRDPLDIRNPVSGFLHNNNNINNPGNTAVLGFVSNNNIITGQKDINHLEEEETKRPSFCSRVIQISPVCGSSNNNEKSPQMVVVAPPPCDPPAPPILLPNNQSLLMSSSSSPAGLQISSPRNTGIRRRKSQVKKVVCIPAPAPANSRSTGEIVPSDLWAWRKYGQKPIKGSPYPRGYYRCSSSKGCSARKQVERSRTDPNMLVITYTSEHNHPWPTQRNALAGSTRSQPNKTNVGPKSPKKEEQKVGGEVTTVPEDPDPGPVKEEHITDFDPGRLEMECADFAEGYQGSYKPGLPGSEEDSFFADLGEIEADSMDMFGFCGDDNKGLDPFGFYEWAGSGGGADPGGGAAADAN